MGCGGNCAECTGCARELVLTQTEIDFLQELGRIPFLPVLRTVSDPAPVFPEAPEERRAETTLLLQCLEKKGLISLDFDKPLKGYVSPLPAFPLCGSMALTERGQKVLEMLDIQGITL